MFHLTAAKNKLTLLPQSREPLTSGSVNVYTVQFDFSVDWDGLYRTAVFKAADGPVSVPLDDTNACGIPWEVLQKPDVRLYAGVYGSLGEEIVLPTVWTSLGVILEGVPAPEDGTHPPTPGPGTPGTNDHRLLTHRDAASQHPIQAITGLSDELNRIPAPAEALTNEELEELLR